MRTNFLEEAVGFFDETFTGDKFPSREEFYYKTINSNFVPNNSKIFFGIYYIKEILDKIQTHDLKKFNLSIQQFEILKVLFFSKKKIITQHDLNLIIFSSKANLSALLLKLENKNLIKRSENNQNRREKTLNLTKKGEKIVQEVFNCCEVDFLDDLISNNEAQEYIRINTKIIEKLILYENERKN